ncbi:MAG: 16S rRNA (adenine(1518)-N(6)/adenine(1519)-N(6))-dimethyltransferase RsmA [Candidatus Paceibacterota bacterium]
MNAKKSLGQHFLTSKAVISDIIEVAALDDTDHVLEIGPGKGILTQALLDTGAHVVAVELDQELSRDLEKQFSGEIDSGQLEIVEKDVLSLEVEEYFKDDYKVVANIPYYITGKILRKFLGGTPQPKQMVLLVQKEVAQRIVARDKKESLLSLAVKVYGEPRIIRKVPRHLFDPQPNVDSAVISIENISRGFFDTLKEDRFFSVIRAGFGHKRKKLSNNLEELYDKKAAEVALQEMERSVNTRAEDLSLHEWKELINSLEKRG